MQTRMNLTILTDRRLTWGRPSVKETAFGTLEGWLDPCAFLPFAFLVVSKRYVKVQEVVVL
jgi:hypothetical protein